MYVVLALGLAGRFIGPMIGVLLGGFCLSTYVDLSSESLKNWKFPSGISGKAIYFSEPAIAQTDPRWMGAWWLGYLVIGSLIIATCSLYLVSKMKKRTKFSDSPILKLQQEINKFPSLNTTDRQSCRCSAAD
jgi:Organic Anion Transporter Polypeptide (OATP) family